MAKVPKGRVRRRATATRDGGLPAPPAPPAPTTPFQEARRAGMQRGARFALPQSLLEFRDDRVIARAPLPEGARRARADRHGLTDAAPLLNDMLAEAAAARDKSAAAQPTEVTGAPADARLVAALALHGQPFGFTADDVLAVRNLARELDAMLSPAARKSLALWLARCDSVADRIEALLP